MALRCVVFTLLAAGLTFGADEGKKTVTGSSEVTVEGQAPKPEPAPPPPPAVKTDDIKHGVDLDLEAVRVALGGGEETWKYFKGTALKYKYQGAIFYSYKPEVVRHNDGLTVTMKTALAHGLRRDDSATLTCEFDTGGILRCAKVSMKLGGNTKDTGDLKAPIKIASDDPELSEALVSRNLISRQLVNTLTSFIYDINEHGSRQHYVTALQYNLHVLSESIIIRQ